MTHEEPCEAGLGLAIYAVILGIAFVLALPVLVVWALWQSWMRQ